MADEWQAWAEEFQSTLPARGATSLRRRTPAHRTRFQSTLPARGATGSSVSLARIAFISIHAPRTGSDEEQAYKAAMKRYISIHAPRTGSDKGQ